MIPRFQWAESGFRIGSRYITFPDNWSAEMVFRRIAMPVLVTGVIAFGWLHPAAAQRWTLSLDGTWSVGESVQPEEIPNTFEHQVAVPGLTNQAKPHFLDVDDDETHEHRWTMNIHHIGPAEPQIQGLG